jgi:lysine 6-dehydrogenase
MNRTTGYSLSITGQMQAEGRVAAGVKTPDQAIDANAYIAELQRRGINIVRSQA